ncbi:serine carboxypeptidase [Mycena floridula]|nr:serine carboxypeptidase [Mycena floridula]
MRVTRIFTLVAAIGPVFCNLFSGHHHAASGIRNLGSQSPLTVNLADFKPHGDLYTLSETSFTVLEHPAFPRHTVRIKKSSFCDNTVDGYTGYIDIEARHLFFYFFESRDQPDKDDVLMWTNGGGPFSLGPGGSSTMGLFMELGPCRITNSSGPYFHPESWNSNSNIFFIDQPVGTGFSYADHGESVGTTEEAAKDVAAFVAVFFEHFSKFKGRPFHLSGESYGGRYLPLFASEIYDQNSKLEAAGLSPINLTSIMIGNGYTDFITQFVSVYDMLCTSASLFPIVDIATCVRMKQVMPRCKKWMQEACFDQFEAINCQAAVGFCSAELQGPFPATIGINPYDIREKCIFDLDSICYPLVKHITSYLDTEKIRKMIGVDSAAGNFSLISLPVNSAFEISMDGFHPTALHVAALLERGIQVLIYVGNFDLLCNWVGNQMWTLALEWSGKEEFNAMPLREWTVDGKRAGLTRSAKGLTFATIDDAGHMAPYNKPKESLELVNRWLHAQGL